MAKKRQVARSEEDLAKKRNLILDSAIALLYEIGYPKTTMSDVAKHAGVGRGTVYWHFPSKEELFLAALMKEVTQMGEEMGPIVDLPMPTGDKLVLIVQETMKMYSKNNMFKAFMSMLIGCSEEFEQQLEQILADIYRSYNSVIAKILEDGKKNGEIRPELDSEIFAASIVVMLDAIYLQIHFGTIPKNLERISAGMIDLIKRGCLTTGGVS